MRKDTRYDIVDYDGSGHRPGGNVFYSSGWLSILKEEYGYDFKIVRHGSGRGEDPLLIFAEIRDIFGDRLISLPFSDYTEPLVKDEEELLKVLEFVKSSYPGFSITLKLHGSLEGISRLGYENVRQAVCHRVHLDGTVDDIWRGTSRTFRKGVNKAVRNGLSVRSCNEDEGVDVFHRMLTALRREKFHILPQPKSFYLLFLEHFINRGNGNVWLAMHQGRPVASALVLHSGKQMFDKMGVSEQAHLEDRPNNILLWEIMKYGQSRGFEFLDMGLSPAGNAGLIRFKDSLGGVRTPINYYRLVPEGYDLQRETRIKAVLSKVTELFVEPGVPDESVQKAGKLLYRYFG